MKVLAVVLSVISLTFGLPTSTSSNGENLMMTFADDGVTLIVEDLDVPVVVTYGVDINKLGFMLYTRDNHAEPQELKNNDVNTLKNSNFNPALPTKFLIHGWQNSYNAESVQIIKDAYLQQSEANIILLDYEKYNSPYISSVSNANSIGENFGLFINFLIGQGLSVDNIHIIGHSLGAHISGFTANKVAGTVPRVTGLDPAGPLFGTNKPVNRLSDDDATIVDVIHTSTSLGMAKAIGTADFFPHGGNSQPDCSGLIAAGCDHASSYRYFTRTIINRLQYPARLCANENDAKESDPKKNKCVESSAVMGEDAPLGGKGFFYVDIPKI